MTQLFSIQTTLFQLDWHEIARGQHQPTSVRSGYFNAKPLRKMCQVIEGSWKAGLPESRASFEVHTGPALREETEYQVYLRAADGVQSIRLVHRDPQLIRHLVGHDRDRVVHGVVNFRGQIGRTAFTVIVDGLPQLLLEFEVFPTKLDYDTDFRSIVADLQLHARGLALEYLRSTCLLGKLTTTSRPTLPEWLLILRHCVNNLEKAIAHIAASPRRRLVETQQLMRAEQVRKLDSLVRTQIRRGAGTGPLLHTARVVMRQKVLASPHLATLNTPEHRWLRTQLEQIQRQLTTVIRANKHSLGNGRQQVVLAELEEFHSRIAWMLRAEPIAAADVKLHSPVASLQLLQAPGYREATQACRALRLAIALEGDAVQISIKELSTLYENWIFVAVLQFIESLAGPQIRRRSGLRLDQVGVSLVLAKGREQSAKFQLDDNRTVEVIYNPQFQNQDAFLIPQRPDILMRITQRGWPTVQIILDAKYRVEMSSEYRRQFGTAGPPVDAINVLHRYRDAILELSRSESGYQAPQRTVVYAAAIFPGSPDVCAEFRNSRLWTSLAKLGIGAIPALPDDRELLDEWLCRVLRESGWEMADRVVPHTTETQHGAWRRAAQEPVLVSVLDPKDCVARFQWLQQTQSAYVRLPLRPHRHFRVTQVAFYCPRPLERKPAIAWVADVHDISIVLRHEIHTPWEPRHAADQATILYHLGPLRRLPKTLLHTDNHETSFRGDRWTTRLALERANTATEIALETIAEWKLYEGLRARNIRFRLKLDSIPHAEDHDACGRAWFLLEDGQRIRLDGANGFLVSAGQSEFHATIQELLRLAEHGRLTTNS